MSDGKNNLEEKLWSQPVSHATPHVDPAAAPTVIALHDLRSGADSEIERLELRVAGLTEEISRLQGDNRKLTMANQKLNAELRELKLVLSKVQMTELRGLEKAGSWLRR